MFDFVGRRNWYFAFSALVIIPGIIALVVWGLRFGIDFSGGTLWELKFASRPDQAKFQEVLVKQGLEVSSIQPVADSDYLLRAKEITQEKNDQTRKVLIQDFGQVTEARFETVGPVISKQLTENSFKAVGLAALAIIVYITWAFRQVPKKISSLRFGISAVIALLHDVLVVVGLFAIFGHFFAAEVDSLLVTALLTIIGFSVHDTIVVFDRIRENLLKNPGLPFDSVVNQSILQTLTRSMSTSLTVVFVLTALLLFGGTSIRWFVVALLIGVVSGTYSSIFNAAQVLVVWQNWVNRKK